MKSWVFIGLVATGLLLSGTVFGNAGTIKCEFCSKSFVPEDNKASRWGAVTAGTAAGAAIGAAGGAYAGAGTGVVAGPAGAAAGAVVFGTIGGVGGAVIGGLGGALYVNSRVKCPHCNKVFKNPKN